MFDVYANKGVNRPALKNTIEGRFSNDKAHFEKDQGRFVQSIVSLTTSLRHQLVSICQLNYQIHCYFLLEKCENLLQCKRFSHFFQQKITVYL